jgi:hypothetical protein
MRRAGRIVLVSAVLALLAGVGATATNAGWETMNVQGFQPGVACRDAVRFELTDARLGLRLGVLAGPGPGVPQRPVFGTDPATFVEPFPVVLDTLVTTPSNPPDLRLLPFDTFNQREYGLFTYAWPGGLLDVGRSLLFVFGYPDFGDQYIDKPGLSQGPVLVANCLLLAERTAPSCRIVEQGKTDTGAAYLVFEVRDQGSGLVRTQVVYTRNATVTPFDFAHGTTDPVRIKVTATDPAQSVGITIDVHDVAGNRGVCDPVMTIVSQDRWLPAVQTFRDLPQAESHVLVQNGTPGLAHLALLVNGRVFLVSGLADGEVRTLNVASAMRPGTGNTIRLVPLGRPGGSALVVISDTG